MYRHPFSIIQLISRVGHLNSYDKQIGLSTFNEGLLKLRSLADLNGLTSAKLLEWSA